MRRSLTIKLVWSFVLVTIVGALLASLLARGMAVRQFNQLVIERAQNNFSELVTDYYAANGSWRGVLVFLRQEPRLPLPQLPRPPEGQATQQTSFVFVLADSNGFVVVPGRPYLVGDRLPQAVLARGEPVEIDGQVVGTVIATGDPPVLEPREQAYLERTNRALLLSALGAALVALLIGVLLARSLTRPLRELTGAIRALGQGDLGQQVAVRSQDEIGELARAFNQVSAELQRATASRRQMTADIAHELRTPLTVLGGYLEAIQEGVLAPTPERLATMHTEIQGLIRLVEDLRTLSLADAGELALNRQLVEPQMLLERAAAAFSHPAEAQQVRLELELQPGLPAVAVDPERLHQVLSNLLANALRYTPPGGTITLAASQGQQQVLLSVQDSGQGIDPAVLPRVFERFYRGDKARQQGNAESGLGLAIARSIVEAHGGQIRAASPGLGRGSSFTILLPAHRL